MKFETLFAADNEAAYVAMLAEAKALAQELSRIARRDRESYGPDSFLYRLTIARANIAHARWLRRAGNPSWRSWATLPKADAANARAERQARRERSRRAAAAVLACTL